MRTATCTPRACAHLPRASAAAPPPPPPAAPRLLASRRALLASPAAAAVLQLSTPRGARAAPSKAPLPPLPPPPAAPPAATIRPELAPARALDSYAGDARLADAQAMFRAALDAPTVAEEERRWSALIDKYGALGAADGAEWAPPLLAGVRGNRGNARSRQGDLAGALEDYNAAILAAPYAIDPVLNRGVVLEQMGAFDAAIADYNAVLAVSDADPAVRVAPSWTLRSACAARAIFARHADASADV